MKTMIEQKKAMNIADMHAEELQQVARIVHKALGWSMIPPEEVIYAREMVQELADSYAKEKSANINALRKDEENEVDENENIDAEIDARDCENYDY